MCALSGGRRARSGNGAALPTASLASLALRSPRKQSREMLGEAPSLQQSPYLSRALAWGFERAALPLAAGAQRPAHLLAEREGWEEQGGR